MATKPATILTCSGCSTTLALDLEYGVATFGVPSNGVRGMLRIGAHAVTVDTYEVNGDLPAWDCPVCGYADSFDIDA